MTTTVKKDGLLDIALLQKHTPATTMITPRPRPPRDAARNTLPGVRPPSPLAKPKRNRHKWVQREREFIKAHYVGTRQSRRQLALLLSVSEFAVAGQVARMGLCRRSDRTKWSPEEDEDLRKLLPKYPISKVSVMMHRSTNAVSARAKRLNISRRERDDWFNLRDVCDILGVDHRWAQKRIANGALKASIHHRPEDPIRQTTSLDEADRPHSYHIKRADLKNFIRRYPQDLSANNIDLVAVVDLLSGLLPV